jgi:hypothetical protein
MAEVRSVIASFRVTPDELASLEESAARAGGSLSDYLRARSFAGAVPHVRHPAVLRPGTYWCAVASYPDRSGILGAYGPYAAQPDATAAIKRLQDAGVHRNELWESTPLRLMDLGLGPDSAPGGSDA